MNIEKRTQFIINIIYFLLWATLIYIAFTVALRYLLPFVIGVFIAYLVQKPAKYFSNRFDVNKQKCAAVLSVAIFLLIIIFISLLAWFLYYQIVNFIEYLSNQSAEIEGLLEKIYAKIEFFLQKINSVNTFKNFYASAIKTLTTKMTTFLSNGITSLIKKLPSTIISCVVTVVATCYIAKDYDRLLKFLKGFINAEHYNTIIVFKNIFTECFSKFLIGYFWLFLITFGELLVGFWLLGVKNTILMALLVAILDLLPIIGTGTILIPWSIFSFIQSNYSLGIGLIILYLIISVIRNFIEPKIIGKQVDINPLFTLIFIFIGFKLGGILGMLAFPIIITVLITYLKRKYCDYI